MNDNEECVCKSLYMCHYNFCPQYIPEEPFVLPCLDFKPYYESLNKLKETE